MDQIAAELKGKSIAYDTEDAINPCMKRIEVIEYRENS
jgi:hypothetical protein